MGSQSNHGGYSFWINLVHSKPTEFHYSTKKKLREIFFSAKYRISSYKTRRYYYFIFIQRSQYKKYAGIIRTRVIFEGGPYMWKYDIISIITCNIIMNLDYHIGRWNHILLYLRYYRAMLTTVCSMIFSRIQVFLKYRQRYLLQIRTKYPHTYILCNKSSVIQIISYNFDYLFFLRKKMYTV